MHYDRAPITEALIDISVALRQQQQNLTDLKDIHKLVRNEYPREELRSITEGQFQIAKEPTATVTSRPLGYAFHSTDGRQVMQARTNGFTFSRLEPYDRWKHLRDEARRLWQIYKATLKPERITGVAVRYINRIVIPLQTVNLAEYLNIRPEIPDSLEAATSEFSFRMVAQQPEYGGVLIVGESSLPPPAAESLAVLLDLWAYKNISDTVSEEDLWSLLESMRRTKNLYFEAAITDKVRELIS